MLDLYRVNDDNCFNYKNGSFKAMIKEVLPTGYLVLKTMDGDEIRQYAFKEVSFVD